MGCKLSVPPQLLPVLALSQPQPPAVVTDAFWVSFHRHSVLCPAHVVNALPCPEPFAFIPTLSNHELVLWLLVALQAFAFLHSTAVALAPTASPFCSVYLVCTRDLLPPPSPSFLS